MQIFHTQKNIKTGSNLIQLNWSYGMFESYFVTFSISNRRICFL